MNFYEEYAIRYYATTPEQKKAARDHWTKCHMENVASGREDLIIFSARILAAMDTADRLRGGATA